MYIVGLLISMFFLVFQSAPRRKGKMIGVGSLQSQIDTGSGYVCGSASSQLQDSNEVATLKEKLTAQETKVALFEQMFDYLGNSDPKLKELMDRLRQQQDGQGGSGGSGQGGSGPSDEF
uniref:Uncharacterized protein n=1 Tax=Noccaea caerulescens TaxID=107243 RepID=A0A1J3G4P3_NOCCA